MQAIYKEDKWVVGETSVNDLPIIVRMRADLPAAPDRLTRENLVVISWAYVANDAGMPVPEDNHNTTRFEDALDASLEKSGAGIQAACITGNGSKEWRYYTQDESGFMASLNRALAGHPSYPLEIKLFKDPDWAALAELLPKA